MGWASDDEGSEGQVGLQQIRVENNCSAIDNSGHSCILMAVGRWAEHERTVSASLIQTFQAKDRRLHIDEQCAAHSSARSVHSLGPGMLPANAEPLGLVCVEVAKHISEDSSCRGQMLSLLGSVYLF